MQVMQVQVAGRDLLQDYLGQAAPASCVTEYNLFSLFRKDFISRYDSVIEGSSVEIAVKDFV